MLNTAGRIGCFFILIGILLLFLFVTSDLAHVPQFTYLLTGVVVLLVGWLLWRNGRAAPRESGRFRILRRRSEDEEK